MPLSAPERLAIRDSVARIGRLSDGLLRLGPLRLGVDGILSWVPGVGEIYSAGAAAFILVQGARAEVPAATLAAAGALLAARTAITAVPLAGPAAADLFTAHRWAAAMIVRAIDRQLAADGDGGGWIDEAPSRRWSGRSARPRRDPGLTGFERYGRS
jgi:hypothetical protein